MPIPKKDHLMITDERELEQAVDQVGRMYRALAALHAEILPQSRQQFALMAEGPLEELRRLEQDISHYVNQTLAPPDPLQPGPKEEADAA
jgi:hypothetical protein